MGKALTPQQQKRNELRTHMQSPAFVQNLKAALPEHMSPDRMIRVALTAISVQPKLLNCTWESIGLALLKASQLGLEPNGRDAHLVPYKAQCQLIPDYKGLVQLAYRSGLITSLTARAVHAKDEFSYEYGTQQHIRHVPCDSDDPGPLVKAWARAQYKNGAEVFVVLERRDVMKRRKSSQYADSPDSPWRRFEEAMWAKSAVKELSKWIPQTPELDLFHAAVSADNRQESGIADTIEIGAGEVFDIDGEFSSEVEEVKPPSKADEVLQEIERRKAEVQQNQEEEAQKQKAKQQQPATEQTKNKPKPAPDEKPSATQLEEMFLWYEQRGVTREQVMQQCGLLSIQDITLGVYKSLQLTAMAINNNETTIEDAFPTAFPEVDPEPEQDANQEASDEWKFPSPPEPEQAQEEAQEEADDSSDFTEKETELLKQFIHRMSSSPDIGKLIKRAKTDARIADSRRAKFVEILEETAAKA